MNFKKLYIPVLAFAFVILFAGNVSAQQAYQYVDTSGGLQTVLAENPTQAILIANNIGLHSGVMLMGGLGGGDPINPQGFDSYFYQFVNTSGGIGSMTAPSANVAIDTAVNIDPHSGVIYVNSVTAL